MKLIAYALVFAAAIGGLKAYAIDSNGMGLFTFLATMVALMLLIIEEK